MAFTEGDWVDLGNSVGRIQSINPTKSTVIAERVSDGRRAERPLPYAEMHWHVLAEDGLKVQMAMDPRTVALAVVQTPVDVVVAALVDAGGQATTIELKGRITPDLIPDADWSRWWTRTQAKLDSDNRIDATRSRDQRYRLLRHGERSVETVGPALQSDTRAGRLLATAPQLREARKIARRTKPPEEHEAALIAAEIEIAVRPDVDPTDRFMAAELAFWSGARSEGEACDLLGEDVRRIDLLRIPQAESRDRALAWAAGQLPAGEATTWPIFEAAGAAGTPWADRALDMAQGDPDIVRAVGRGMLGWAVPGSEEAGQHRYPGDLEVLDKRIDRTRPWLAIGDPVLLEGILAGALRAMETLPETTGLNENFWRDVMRRLAGAAYSAHDMLAPRPGIDRGTRLRPAAIRSLIEVWPSGNAAILEGLVLSGYLAVPRDYRSVFETYCASRRIDPVAKGMEVARSSAGPAARTIAVQAFHLAAQSRREEADLAAAGNLAAALAPGDQGVSDVLERMAERLADSLLQCEIVEGTAWFSKDSWARFSGTIAGRIGEALERERVAEAASARLAQEVTELKTALAIRTQALASVRSSTGAGERAGVARNTAMTLKPIAAALGDSYEANSLPALRNRLISILGRQQLQVIGAVGDVQSFHPQRHQWVGEGFPTDSVRLLSPGFTVRDEDDVDSVVIPARVVEGEE